MRSIDINDITIDRFFDWLRRCRWKSQLLHDVIKGVVCLEVAGCSGLARW